MKDRDVHLLNINLLHSLYVASLPLKCQNGVFIFTYISVVQETMASTNRFPHHLDYLSIFSCAVAQTENSWSLSSIQDSRFLTNLDKKLSLSYVIWYSLTLQVFHPDTCFFLNNLTDQGKVLNDWLEPTLWFVLRIITKRHNREEILKC